MTSTIGQRAPGPRGLAAVGAVRHFLRDPLDYLVSLRQYGEVVRSGVWPYVFHTFFDPRGIRHIFVDHPERFTKLALAPARIGRVFAEPESHTIQAVVDEDQLSLAIGRNGQNVRLASELTGWKIDLFSSREWLERGGEGPLFAPLAPEDEMMAEVPLSQ